MHINGDTIKSLTYRNQRNYEWAKKHYLDNYMYDAIEILASNDNILIKGFFDVNGYEAEARILLDISSNYVGHSCSCHFNSHDKPCGHVLALMLFINDFDLSDEPEFYDPVDIELMINNDNEKMDFKTFARINHGQELIEKLRLEIVNKTNEIMNEKKYQIYLNFETTYNGFSIDRIRLKVGQNNKNYFIKNIDNFIKDVKNKNYHKYSKKLAFIHSIKSFDEISKVIYEKLIIPTKQSKMEEYSYYYNNGLKEAINVNAKVIDLLFEHLTNISQEYSNCQLIEDIRPIKMNIKQVGELYQIIWETTENTISTYKGIYTFDTYDLKIVKVANLNPNINPFFLDYNPEYLYSKESLFQLTSILNELCDIEWHGIDVNELDIANEEIKMYGDIVNNNIEIRLESTNLLTQESKNILKLDNYRELSVNALRAHHIIKNEAREINLNAGLAYFDIDSDQTIDFFSRGVDKLKEYCEILVSDSFKNIHKARSLNLSVGVKINNNLLEINVKSIDFNKEELIDILKEYKKKTKYYKLKNGDILNIQNKDLEELMQLSDGLAISEKDLLNDTTNVPLFRSFYTKEKIDTLEHLNFNVSNSFEQFISNFNTMKMQELNINNRYDSILHSYQKTGVKWLMLLAEYGFNGILADDMGLGKTIQIISLLETIPKNNKANIVIAPASLLLNWEQELNKFNSSLKALCIHGNQDERKKQLKNYQDYDLLITTYDYLKRDIDLYKNKEFNFAILDEAQYIKNPKTLAAKSVKKIKAIHRIALSGTPIENSLSELWSIFDYLMPAYLFNYNHFKKVFETPIVKDKDENKRALLKTMVEPFILRRKKKEVLSELPDKIEKVLKLEFNEHEKKLYVAKLAEANQQVQELLAMDIPNKIMILKILTELRQICCEPRLLYDNVKTVSSKLQGCMEVLENIVENEEKTLIFSSFTSSLDLIKEELNKRKISYYTITGSVTKVKRMDIVNKFQEDKTSVLLISLKAGGTGLNLTAATSVIHFDPWWNIAAENQATDRTYRIGQENNVTVYKLIMKDSIEEKIIELQQSKKDLSDMFVEDSQGSISSLSKDEILNLFNNDIK